MDEMTEKQEEATRIIEAIGNITLNECYVPVINQVCDCEKHLTQFPGGWRCDPSWRMTACCVSGAGLTDKI